MFDDLVTGFAYFGGGMGIPIVVLTAAGLAAAKLRRRAPAILIVGARSGSLLITIAGKWLTPSARPALTDAGPQNPLSGPPPPLTTGPVHEPSHNQARSGARSPGIRHQKAAPNQKRQGRPFR